MQVLIPEPISQAGRRLLLERGYTLTEPEPGSDLRPFLPETDAILSRNVPISADLMDLAPRLAVIAVHGVGTDHIDLEHARRRQIAVTTTPGANAEAVAELALGLLLACARQLPQMDAALRAGRFDARYAASGLELRGKTLGIVGFGKTGSLLAGMAAQGLAMRVLVYDRSADRKTMPPYAEVIPTLDGLLARCDAVSLHVPLTDETRGLLSRRRIGLLKPGCMVINTARGALIDMDALTEALLAGRIRAGLDVWEPEPPVSVPDLPGTVLTPHIGAASAEALDAMAAGAARSIIRVLEGAEA